MIVDDFRMITPRLFLCRTRTTACLPSLFSLLDFPLLKTCDGCTYVMCETEKEVGALTRGTMGGSGSGSSHLDTVLPSSSSSPSLPLLLLPPPPPAAPAALSAPAGILPSPTSPLGDAFGRDLVGPDWNAVLRPQGGPAGGGGGGGSAMTRTQPRVKGTTARLRPLRHTSVTWGECGVLGGLLFCLGCCLQPWPTDR